MFLQKKAEFAYLYLGNDPEYEYLDPPSRMRLYINNTAPDVLLDQKSIYLLKTPRLRS